ncbi:lipopolysaccharide transport system ATP-binding protein [Desulfomicrobium norvegicum]|uniref:Lipopolysaccharide transport system ATP-binding protein n=1 Tax=Desulfomicrobium norvegicum (strain DSM 1741 / NCIMB 8310) TaxID=52561 RepID=A0A8G2C1A6_DESNO|nr:ABC transporter ATP-binding protein [Desulfomicrobium norvegicum]SFL46901.1 lipopolysaccharide transport system ATP-binding protein [Desulfomicrobium norvegicum]
MKPIISVEGLGKKYVIRHEGQTHYKSLREEIFQLPKKLFRRQDNKEEFWALKDLNFEVMPGDRIGIVGHNGAGKSTLLKILSRITEPTAGRVHLRGRVASLLEVGTGFHSELTGRENIFLNAAILGMSRFEVNKKFDEIVDFAGVERFLDTPVKRYSSGMYVRLAFAVAASLDPEILIVDEVLAVGDMDFQKKCIRKMEEVSSEKGKTVLLVSHQLHFVNKLCNRAILFGNGCVLAEGSASEITDKYLADRSEQVKKGDIVVRDKDSDFPFLRKVILSASDGTSLTSCTSHTELVLSCKISPGKLPKNKQYQILWFIKNESDDVVTASASETMHDFSVNSSIENVLCIIKLDPLPIGSYYFRIVLHVPGADNFDDVDAVLPFSVIRQAYGSQNLGSSHDYSAKLFLKNQWKIQ